MRGNMSRIQSTPYPAAELIEARDKSGKSNSEIALETGISRPKVIEVFHGKSNNIDHVRAVAAAVGYEIQVTLTEAA